MIATASEFFSPIRLFLCIASFGLVSLCLKHIILPWLLTRFCGRVDGSQVWIPDLLHTSEDSPIHLPPWATAPKMLKRNGAGPWIRLVAASDEQKLKFLKACNVEALSGDVFQRCVREAVRIRGELAYDGYTDFVQSRFIEADKAYPYPTKDKTWFGISGWYAELSPKMQLNMNGVLIAGTEHILSGLLAAIYLFWNHDLRYFYASIMLDTCYNVVDSLLMIISSLIKKNVSLTGYPSQVFLLMHLHHSCAMIMCYIALEFEIDPSLVSEFLISLLSVTGGLHYLNQIVDISHLADNPSFSLAFNLVIFACCIWFRGLYWFVLVFRALRLAFSISRTIAIVSSLAMLFLTIFNLEFVSLYTNVCRTAYKRWIKSRQEKHKID